MFICVCHSINEERLREIIRNGCDTIPKLKTEFGITAQCGLCFPEVMRILKEEKKENG